MEDVINTYQRPKLEEHFGHLFLITRMLSHLKEGGLQNDQLSLFLSNKVVITMQEQYDDFFVPVRTRIRAGKGSLRNNGADYLTYTLLDSIVDIYFPILEAIGEKDVGKRLGDDRAEAVIVECPRRVLAR